MWRKVAHLVQTVKPQMLCFPSGDASDAESQLEQEEKKVSSEGNYSRMLRSSYMPHITLL